MNEPMGNICSENSRNFMKFIEHVISKYGVTLVIAPYDPMVIRKCERAYVLRRWKGNRRN